jgi:hypothetical protein
MPVGEDIPRELLGSRHGVLVAGDGVFWVQRARTRRKARRTYLSLWDWLVLDPARIGASAGDDLIVRRVERERVVEERQVRIPGEPGPDIGVREPRRPRPAGGAGEAALDAP